MYKKLPAAIKNYLNKYVRKKRIVIKYFIVCEFFLELQCLVDDLVDVLELSMFIKAYIQWKWLTFDEVERGPRHEKKLFFLHTT